MNNNNYNNHQNKHISTLSHLGKCWRVISRRIQTYFDNSRTLTSVVVYHNPAKRKRILVLIGKEYRKLKLKKESDRERSHFGFFLFTFALINKIRGRKHRLQEEEKEKYRPNIFWCWTNIIMNPFAIVWNSINFYDHSLMLTHFLEEK